LLLAFLLAFISIANTSFAQTGTGSISQREAQLQAENAELQKQLDAALQTISQQQSELDAVKKELAGTPATTAGSAAALADNEAQQPSPTAGYTSISKPATRYARAKQDSTTSVTRLNTEQLARGGVEDISRLEFLAPGLRFGQSGHDVRLSMRGARTNSIGPEGTSAVAVFEDGIYLSTSTERLNQYIDVDYIDVLRGPQNTAFGHNAYAGAINIVTNKPDFEGFYGYAVADVGLPDKSRWQLTLNIPITETIALRFAGLTETRSGWINNHVIGSDADDLNDRKVQPMRASLLWQPNEDFSLLFWSRYQDENGAGTAPWGYQQIGAYVDGELEPGNQWGPDGFTPDKDPYNVYRNFVAAISYENWVNTVELNWDMGFADLKWLSNYTSFHGKQTYDNDYTDIGETNSSAFAGWENSQTSWSSELRLTSNSSGAFSWLAGLYFDNRDTDWGWLESDNGALRQPDWDVDGTYKTDTTAVFAQASYAFDSDWTVTGGLRWNKDSKTTRTDIKGDWDDVLWKAAVAYDISESMMTYFSASTGYQAGGINTATGVNPTWEPEKLTAYELGFKSMLADGRLSLDLSLWYNDFKDVQSQSFQVLPYPGSPEATEYTGNGGAMHASGIEAEIQWLPMKNWNVSSFVTYTDTEFDNYSSANLAGLGDIPGHTEGDELSYEGWNTALSPKFVVGLQTSYDFYFENWGVLTPYLQTTYASSYYANDANLAGVKQDSNSRTDIRVIWRTPSEHFRLQFYYLNFEDDATLNWARAYSPAARPEITTLQGNWNNPNTYGIIFDFTF